MKKIIIISLIALYIMCITACSKENIEEKPIKEYEHADSFVKVTPETNVNTENDSIENSNTEYEIKEPQWFKDENKVEGEQTIVDSVITSVDVDENEVLCHMKFSDVTIEKNELPSNIVSDIEFGIIEEDVACVCYELAKNYLGDISEMITSDWLSTTEYNDSYTQIFLINGNHYKFVIKYDNTIVKMTDII